MAPKSTSHHSSALNTSSVWHTDPPAYDPSVLLSLQRFAVAEAKVLDCEAVPLSARLVLHAAVVGVAVNPGVGVRVIVGVRVGVEVGVEVGVWVGVEVGVRVIVGVCVGVYVGVEVGVRDGVGVGVAV